jgi:hypothetical protein
VRLFGLLAVVGWLLLAGCGTTGATSRFEVTLDPAVPTVAVAAIRVAPVTMAVDAPRLYAIGTHEWGRLDADDLTNLEQSLATTIATRTSSTVTVPDTRIDIHVHVRRYLVAHSNTGAGVLACVTWAAVTPSGQIVFQEQFYAPGSVAYVGTIGGLKDAVHRSIVRRIATTSLYLAAGHAVAGASPTEYPGTYSTLDEAIEVPPEVLVSRGDPNAMASSDPWTSVPGLFAVTAAGGPPWRAAKPPTDFDWEAFLRSPPSP